MKSLLRLHRCALTLESPMSTYPIITIVIIHAVNHSYNLSFFSLNIKMFSLFLHILCSKRREASVFIKKTNSCSKMILAHLYKSTGSYCCHPAILSVMGKVLSGKLSGFVIITPHLDSLTT